jgi:SAM-dependent methyltransferase
MKYQSLLSLDRRRKREVAYLHAVRSYELELLLRQFEQWFRQGPVLELGSGTGQQLRLLKRLEIDIIGVEIEDGWYDDCPVEEIIKFDGSRLPFPDNTFDLVFSSNVMEHVRDFQGIQLEIARVLKPTGLALHEMPSPSWRFWAVLSHYLTLPNRFWLWLFKCGRSGQRVAEQYDATRAARAASSGKASFRKILAALFPEKHGVFGNRLTEAYEFSRTAWKRRFEKTGWRILRNEPVRVFYTASHLLRYAIGLPTRSLLSYVLGSSSHAYLVAPGMNEDRT